MNKRFLPIRDAANHPDCPFDEKGLRNRIQRSIPKTDTSGTVVDPGDPDLANCFISVRGRRKSSVLVDMPRLLQVLDSRRLGGA